MAEAATDWRSTLPDDLKTSPVIQDFKDVAGVVKSLIETKSFVGNSIRIPGPDAGAEARMDVVTKLKEKMPELILIPDGEDDVAKAAREVARSRLGTPKEAKEYTLQKDIEIPSDRLEQLREEAFSLRLDREQFRAFAKKEADRIAAMSQVQKDAQAALKKELGAAFDERTASAAAIAAKLGASEALVSALKAGAVDGATFKMFSAIAKGFGETRQVADQTGAVGGKPTPDEARAQRAEIMGRREYFDPKPNQMDIHRALVAKVQALNELIEG